MIELPRIFHLNFDPAGYAVSQEDASEACRRWPEVWKAQPWTDDEKDAVRAAAVADQRARHLFHVKINAL